VGRMEGEGVAERKKEAKKKGKEKGEHGMNE
jgi:hypothetical protein